MDRVQARKDLIAQDQQAFLGIDQTQLDNLAQAIIDAKRIYVGGWGRAGNVVKILAMNCSQAGLTAHIIGDNTTPSIHEGDLLVIGTGGGETKTMALIAKQAKEHGAKVGCITGNPDSTIAKLSEYPVIVPKMDIPEGTPTKAHGSFYHVMLMVTDIVMAYVCEVLGVTSEDIHYNHNNLE